MKYPYGVQNIDKEIDEHVIVAEMNLTGIAGKLASVDELLHQSLREAKSYQWVMDRTGWDLMSLVYRAEELGFNDMRLVP